MHQFSIIQNYSGGIHDGITHVLLKIYNEVSHTKVLC